MKHPQNGACVNKKRKSQVQEEVLIKVVRGCIIQHLQVLHENQKPDDNDILQVGVNTVKVDKEALELKFHQSERLNWTAVTATISQDAKDSDVILAARCQLLEIPGVMDGPNLLPGAMNEPHVQPYAMGQQPGAMADLNLQPAVVGQLNPQPGSMANLNLDSDFMGDVTSEQGQHDREEEVLQPLSRS